MVENQNITNLSNERSESYASVVLDDSKVTILREGEDTAFCLSLYCILFIYDVAKLKKKVIKFPCFPYFWVYIVEADSFSDFNFFSAV